MATLFYYLLEPNTSESLLFFFFSFFFTPLLNLLENPTGYIPFKLVQANLTAFNYSHSSLGLPYPSSLPWLLQCPCHWSLISLVLCLSLCLFPAQQEDRQVQVYKSDRVRTSPLLPIILRRVPMGAFRSTGAAAPFLPVCPPLCSCCLGSSCSSGTMAGPHLPLLLPFPLPGRPSPQMLIWWRSYFLPISVQLSPSW